MKDKAPDRRSSCDQWAIVACVAMLLIVGALAWRHPLGTFATETDFYGVYAPQANNLLAGRPYTYRRGAFGYPWLVGVISLATGDLFTAGKILSVVSSVLLLWFAYRVLRCVTDPLVALGAIALTGIALVPHAFVAATDPVAAALVWAALWVIVRRDSAGPRAWCVAGLLAGASWLVRFQSLFVLAGMFLGALLWAGGPWRRRAACAGAFFGGALLMMAPWLITNWRTNGSPFANELYLQMAAHLYDPDHEWPMTFKYKFGPRFTSMGQVLMADPPHALRQTLHEIFVDDPQTLAEQILRFPGYLFVGVGLLVLGRTSDPRRRLVLWTCLLGYLMLGMSSFEPRYYIFLLPVLFAALAVPLLNERFGVGRWVGLLVFLIVAGTIASNAINETKKVLREEPRQLLPIAALIRQHTKPGDLILSRKPHLGYLTGCEVKFPTANTVEEFVAFAHDNHAKYLIYSAYEAKLWPGLKSLADPTAVPATLQMVYRDAPTDTLVYEVR